MKTNIYLSIYLSIFGFFPSKSLISFSLLHSFYPISTSVLFISIYLSIYPSIKSFFLLSFLSSSSSSETTLPFSTPAASDSHACPVARDTNFRNNDLPVTRDYYKTRFDINSLCLQLIPEEPLHNHSCVTRRILLLGSPVYRDIPLIELNEAKNKCIFFDLSSFVLDSELVNSARMDKRVIWCIQNIRCHFKISPLSAIISILLQIIKEIAICH
ncbi:unnamed protein product [Acanthosepion pharaonis]|uniref:Uncharacterized protein n=1 Tax=Acanthosepion pharaonis TaxID=158019 RepID=A0A812ASJ5_ACAPH|nr:unnamed protein product [Sepia pharaonis]